MRCYETAIQYSEGRPTAGQSARWTGREKFFQKKCGGRWDRRVAVLVDTSTTWGRGVVSGIISFCRVHQNWEVFVEARGQQEQMRLPRGWSGHGVIARVSDTKLLRELQESRLPVINVSGIQLASSAQFPQVTTDLVASGKMAAMHFIDRGFRNFAYFSLQGLNYVLLHQQAFLDAVIQAGGLTTTMSVKPTAGTEPDWRLDLVKLGDWLRNLPKPLPCCAGTPAAPAKLYLPATKRAFISLKKLPFSASRMMKSSVKLP